MPDAEPTEDMKGIQNTNASPIGRSPAARITAECCMLLGHVLS